MIIKIVEKSVESLFDFQTLSFLPSFLVTTISFETDQNFLALLFLKNIINWKDKI